MLQTATTLVHLIINSAMFTWNPAKTSAKLGLNEDYLKCTSKDGSGFKTTLGT